MQTNDIPRHIFIPAQKWVCRCTKAVSANSAQMARQPPSILQTTIET